ncbi:MAG: galactose mutarotase [Bacteroidales bacterium]|nr:galactose mutarotase [Bacteroidales bacterium]
MKNILIGTFILALALVSCKPKPETVAPISDVVWEGSGDQVVKLITLTNKNGMQIKITNYGAILTYVAVPDKAGVVENVVLGFDSLSQYRSGHPFFGSTIGRYGNRIGGAKFTLNDTVYTLSANDGVNTLHGGPEGFHRKLFSIDTVYSAEGAMVVALSRVSADMEEGYPGNLKVKVTYTLTDSNEIKINYEAETDKATVLNLTNHSYFNLTGCKETILGHELVLYADSITPTDALLIPTGELKAVAETPFDFTTAHTMGERIDQVPGGYDINYKVRNTTGEYVLAAEVYEPKSGRVMQTYSTEPGIQFYSGNFLDGKFVGHGGVKYDKYYGFCLETQHFPDSPNKPNFPSTVLLPGEKYTSVTVYQFSVR